MALNDTPIPGQGTDHEDLDALLAEALDGTDERRAALLMALILTRLYATRDADLSRLRRDGPPPVRPL